MLTQRTRSPDAGRGADAEREGRLVIGDWIMGIGSKGGDGPTTLLSRFAEQLRRAPGAGEGGFKVGSLGRGDISEVA